jgi:hypothetical protein
MILILRAGTYYDYSTFIISESFGGSGGRRVGGSVPGPETLSLVTPAGWAAGLLGLVGLTGSRSFSQGGHNHCIKICDLKNRKFKKKIN